MTKRIYLYDSTLRDGAQTQGVDFSAVDKAEIAAMLDELGIDYIEGGWPGANPTDDAFFEDLPKLKHSKISAFGMTRRPSMSADNDPGLNQLVNSGAKAICIVGKSWDFHVTEALGIELTQNIQMVSSSIEYLNSKIDEVMFDAEHFFDGYKANPEYALQVIKAAYDANARWVVLCDTNGGTLPHEISEIVTEVAKHIPGENIGIHCHNDTENAVANSIAAVQAGACQIQGTINGYGERCGNANLVALIPTLVYKMGYDVGIEKEKIKGLTKLTNALDDKLNRPRYRHAAYVGSSAFAHKGGLHVSAVVKAPEAYEHIKPELIGNERIMLVSNQAGRANIINRIKSLGIEFDEKDKAIGTLVDQVKDLEKQGYAFDSADASFELLVRRALGTVPEFFKVKHFRVLDERRWNVLGELITISEAKTRVEIDDKELLTVTEGNGPVNVLNNALKEAIATKYPVISQIHLTDYKVRILQAEKGTAAVTRVQIESSDETGNRWTTVGVSENVIDASFNALVDSFRYKLLKD